MLMIVLSMCSSEVESLSDVCLHVAELMSNKLSSLPQYNCLHLSPARFWNHDKQRYLYVSLYLLSLCST